MRELFALFLFIFLIFVLVPFLPQGKVDEKDAASFVYEDLKQRYPGASVSIISVSKDGEGYSIKAKVVRGAESPCPERMHLFYNYPEERFIPRPPEIITSGCRVCDAGLGTLAFPEEAIIASHQFDKSGRVASFLERNPTAKPLVFEKDGLWEVRWKGANETLKVFVWRNGTFKGASR